MGINDQRPQVSVGHGALETDRMEESAQFMRTIGMRTVFQGPEVSVYELRGGTHLILMLKSSGVPGNASFDLMLMIFIQLTSLLRHWGLPQHQSRPDQQSITRFSVSMILPGMSSHFSQVMYRAIRCKAAELGR
ncbi:MAG: glyoxalase [Nitrospira sp.]|nr:MAG: glyoxalase [Nitrospira sp.]